jgi:CheY-like chemotaxis protein
MMSSRGKKIFILMADDDEDDFILVRDAFREAQLSVNLRLVGDGQELMEYLSGGYSDPESEDPTPDLILLDLNMPRKDGRAALEEIKSLPHLKSIPVIVLTTSKEEEDVQYCYSHGANSFITKPLAFTELIQVIQSVTAYWFSIVRLPDLEELEHKQTPPAFLGAGPI